MAKCKRIPFPKQKICLGDFRHIMVIQGRNIKAPKEGVDFDEIFDDKLTIKVAVKTLGSLGRGVEVFDATNVGVTATHQIITIRVVLGLTSESWGVIKGVKYRFLTVPGDLDLDGRYTVIFATVRGPEGIKANFA